MEYIYKVATNAAQDVNEHGETRKIFRSEKEQRQGRQNIDAAQQYIVDAAPDAADVDLGRIISITNQDLADKVLYATGTYSWAETSKSASEDVQTMPEASHELVGKVVHYTGPNTSSYTTGKNYECTSEQAWVSVSGKFEGDPNTGIVVAYDSSVNTNTISSTLPIMVEGVVDGGTFSSGLNKIYRSDIPTVQISLAPGDYVIGGNYIFTPLTETPRTGLYTTEIIAKTGASAESTLATFKTTVNESISSVVTSVSNTSILHIETTSDLYVRVTVLHSGEYDATGKLKASDTKLNAKLSANLYIHSIGIQVHGSDTGVEANVDNITIEGNGTIEQPLHATNIKQFASLDEFPTAGNASMDCLYIDKTSGIAYRFTGNTASESGTYEPLLRPPTEKGVYAMASGEWHHIMPLKKTIVKNYPVDDTEGMYRIAIDYINGYIYDKITVTANVPDGTACELALYNTDSATKEPITVTSGTPYTIVEKGDFEVWVKCSGRVTISVVAEVV